MPEFGGLVILQLRVTLAPWWAITMVLLVVRNTSPPARAPVPTSRGGLDWWTRVGPINVK